MLAMDPMLALKIFWSNLLHEFVLKKRRKKALQVSREYINHARDAKLSDAKVLQRIALLPSLNFWDYLEFPSLLLRRL